MHFRLSKLAAAACLTAAALATTPARASGIPVIDVANLIQTIQQVLNDITEIQNQVQQITQLQDQLNSINGFRNLGQVFNNPLLRNYVPAEAYRQSPLVVLRGRTDGTTDSPIESRIARERAAAVRDYLAAAGVDPTRIRATYQPAGDHAADNTAATGRAANRRVEVEVYRTAPVPVGVATTNAVSSNAAQP